MSKYSENLDKIRALNGVVRAKALPAKTAALLGIDKIDGENSLKIVNKGEESHLYLSGSVGQSWFDEGGITEKEVRDALKALPKGKKINVHINSEGGSVKEGLGIYNALKERSKDVTAYVDGYALSIASVIPLAAGKVVSPKSAIWMIHNAWSMAQGNADDMDKQATMLREHDAMLAEIISENTGQTIDKIRSDMKSETWIRGSAAVEYGLADETDESEDCNDGYCALPQAWLDRCQNLSPEILNALRHTPRVLSAPSNEVKGPITDSAEEISPEKTGEKKPETAAAQAGGTQTQQNTMPNETTPAAASTSATDALAQIAALKEQIITDRVTSYVKAQKITKAEVPIFVKAALADEGKTFEVLDAKVSATSSAPSPVAGSVFEVGASDSSPVQARYSALSEKSPKARYSALKKDWNSMINDAFQQDAIKNAPLLKMGAMPMNSNTYSATLVTAFLTEGATTVLQNKWAPLRAFNRDFSTDAYKPKAVAQHKFVTAGPTVQTDATDFESGNSTVAPITITPHQYTSSINVSNSDLNSGLRMENLMTIAVAQLANKVIEAATAPITLANFATDWTGGSSNVVTSANFDFSTLGKIWGYAQKFNQKHLILDGTYLAKLLNQPTYFQQIEEGEGAYKAFGWDLICLNSDWTGASNNAVGFACDPQAIAALMGLPLTPPSIPGNTLQQGTFTIPGVEASVQTNSWFNLGSRAAWMSFDVMAGFAKMDATAGLVICSS